MASNTRRISKCGLQTNLKVASGPEKGAKLLIPGGGFIGMYSEIRAETLLSTRAASWVRIRADIYVRFRAEIWVQISAEIYLQIRAESYVQIRSENRLRIRAEIWVLIRAEIWVQIRADRWVDVVSPLVGTKRHFGRRFATSSGEAPTQRFRFWMVCFAPTPLATGWK